MSSLQSPRACAGPSTFVRLCSGTTSGPALRSLTSTCWAGQWKQKVCTHTHTHTHIPHTTHRTHTHHTPHTHTDTRAHTHTHTHAHTHTHTLSAPGYIKLVIHSTRRPPSIAALPVACREREFVRTLLAAAITYDIANECRERHIPNCPCDFSVPFITRTENQTIIGGCGAHFDHASGLTRKVMTVAPTGTSADLVVEHNINAGTIVSTTPTHCACVVQTHPPTVHV